MDNQIENCLIGRSTQADADQECSEWDACMHANPVPSAGLQFRAEKWSSGLLRRAEEGWGEQMQMQVCQGRPLMQLLMQITTALYLAITLSSFDASSLFQTWQNQREREERRYIQPPEKTPQVFGLLLENVKSNQSLSQVPQPTCFFKLGGDPVYQSLCVCLSGSAPVIVK